MLSFSKLFGWGKLQNTGSEMMDNSILVIGWNFDEHIWFATKYIGLKYQVLFSQNCSKRDHFPFCLRQVRYFV